MKIAEDAPQDEAGELSVLRARCDALRAVNNAVLNANVELTRLIMQYERHQKGER